MKNLRQVKDLIKNLARENAQRKLKKYREKKTKN